MAVPIVRTANIIEEVATIDLIGHRVGKNLRRHRINRIGISDRYRTGSNTRLGVYCFWGVPKWALNWNRLLLENNKYNTNLILI